MSVIANEIAHLLGRRYPKFVYGGRPRSRPANLEYLPVFAFHSLHPADFEAKLQYLRAINCRTITLDDAVAWMRREMTLPANCVCLTIDDGRLSTWTVGYPLLKRYGMCATAFVIPGYVPNCPSRPTLDDVWAGRASSNTVDVNEDEDRCALACWDEIKHMHESGVVQIESHSMLHRRVSTQSDIVAFVEPRLERHLYDTPLPLGARAPWTRARIDDCLGMPLLGHSPVLSVSHGLRLPANWASPFIDHVRRCGGEAFFRRRGWRRELLKLARTVAHMPTEAVDTRQTQQWELETSKRMLEERLPGKIVRHLCYPHGHGSDRANGLCAEVGYSTAVWNMLDARTTNRRGCGPFRIGRIKHDYIYRLPATTSGGRPCKSLTRVVSEKVLRRVRGDTGY